VNTDSIVSQVNVYTSVTVSSSTADKVQTPALVHSAESVSHAAVAALFLTTAKGIIPLVVEVVAVPSPVAIISTHVAEAGITKPSSLLFDS